MRIVAKYSFNNGEQTVNSKYPHLLTEVLTVISQIDASVHMTKTSKEKTMMGRKLYNPTALNKSFKVEFKKYGWKSVRVKCNYPKDLYVPGYAPPQLGKGAFREMDFVKNHLGIELQFGKYSFMVYREKKRAN